MAAKKPAAKKAAKKRAPANAFKKGHKNGGRPKGSPNKATKEIRAMAQGLLEDEEYQANLRERLQSGKIAPGVESMLYHYAFGKPKERIEVTDKTPRPVRDDLMREIALRTLKDLDDTADIGA